MRVYMKLISRVLLSIIRQKIKTLLLFGITTIMSLSLITSLFLTWTITKTSDQLVTQLNPYIKVSGVTQRNFDFYNKVAQMSEVELVDYQASLTLDVEGVKQFSKETQSATTTNVIFLEGSGQTTPQAIKSNTAQLIEGRVFTEAEIKEGRPVAIITANWARVNNVGVGDTIKGAYKQIDPRLNPESPDGVKKQVPLFEVNSEVNVIGIVDVKDQNIVLPSILGLSKEERKLAKQYEEDVLHNRIIVPSQQIVQKKLEMSQRLLAYPEVADQFADVAEPAYNFMVKVKSVQNMEVLLKKIQDTKPSNTITIFSDYQKVQTALAQANTFKGMANIFLIVSVGTLSLLLTLLLIIFVYDRKIEMGLLFSLGISKIQLITQFICEVLIITITAIIISLGLSIPVIGTIQGQIAVVEKELIQKENNKLEMHDTYRTSDFFIQNKSNEIIDESKNTINFGAILSIGGMSTGVVLAATALPIVYIGRINPKKLLL